MSDLDACFPRLSGTVYQITSPGTAAYNCVAWAAGDSTRWWWPDVFGISYWPSDVPREESIAAFQEAFERLGYVSCPDGVVEDGYEKVALFCDTTGRPSHAARQLPTGRWTSKCGSLQDIEHEIDAFAGSSYGSVSCYMRRRRLS